MIWSTVWFSLLPDKSRVSLQPIWHRHAAKSVLLILVNPAKADSLFQIQHLFIRNLVFDKYKPEDVNPWNGAGGKLATAGLADPLCLDECSIDINLWPVSIKQGKCVPFDMKCCFDTEEEILSSWATIVTLGVGFGLKTKKRTVDRRGRLPAAGPVNSDLWNVWVWLVWLAKLQYLHLRRAVISSWLRTIASKAASSISRLSGEVPAISHRYLDSAAHFEIFLS